MDRIMMKIDDFLGMHRSLSNNIGLLRIQKERAEKSQFRFLVGTRFRTIQWFIKGLGKSIAGPDGQFRRFLQAD